MSSMEKDMYYEEHYSDIYNDDNEMYSTSFEVYSKASKKGDEWKQSKKERDGERSKARQLKRNGWEVNASSNCNLYRSFCGTYDL